ncbi:hypothetical protein [Streptomyces longwoodensis]|uniref:hypothetical protein n=1 Tax=Streptomyces longwoodensis TaxID=68231 RepID=UPI00340525A7
MDNNHSTASALLIDADKSPLAVLDEEAVRLADLLAAHPSVTTTHAFSGEDDVTFTTTHGPWSLTFQEGTDGQVLRHPSEKPVRAGALEPGSIVADVVAPALLAHPAYRDVTDAGLQNYTIHLTSGEHYTLSLRPQDAPDGR